MTAERLLANEWLPRAQSLARLFHQDDSIAVMVVHRAAARLDDAFRKQRKRLYYRPGGEPRRCKAYLPPAAVLQLLVFREWERFERRSELGDHPLDTPAFAARYVKHLVFISLRRNSFHVALTLCRLLFNYDTRRSMDIYESLLAAEEFVKEDYYYRARKRILMREVQRRFPMLQRVQGSRGEERFALPFDDHAGGAAVTAALEACTPWGTRCGDEGADPELQRCHTLIHPRCFETAARGAAAGPLPRTAIPPFEKCHAPARMAAEECGGTPAGLPT